MFSWLDKANGLVLFALWSGITCLLIWIVSYVVGKLGLITLRPKPNLTEHYISMGLLLPAFVLAMCLVFFNLGSSPISIIIIPAMAIPIRWFLLLLRTVTGTRWWVAILFFFTAVASLFEIFGFWAVGIAPPGWEKIIAFIALNVIASFLCATASIFVREILVHWYSARALFRESGEDVLQRHESHGMPFALYLRGFYQELHVSFAASPNPFLWFGRRRVESAICKILKIPVICLDIPSAPAPLSGVIRFKRRTGGLAVVHFDANQQGTDHYPLPGQPDQRY